MPASTPGGASGKGVSALAESPAIETVEGPLGDDGLREVAGLYGQADPKYRADAFLRHLLTEGPGGPALHAFARSDGRAVAHCCVVPLPARRGGRPLRSGKVEAFFVEEAYRDATVEDRPLAIALLGRLYAFADEHGLEVLHAYATRELGVLHRLLGFRALSVGEPSLVAVTGSATGRARALGLAQAAAREAAGAVTGRGAPVVRPLGDDDADLVGTGAGSEGWTIAGEDLWSWYRASELLRVVELRGRRAGRALVQLHGPGDGLLLVSWRPARPTVAAAVAALRACARLARASGAPTLRFQPWHADDGRLRRACRSLGFVPRHDLTTLYVRSRDPELPAPVLTPFFYLTF